MILKIPGGMKIHLLLALSGFAIGFALQTFAQQKDTIDPRIVQQRDLLGIPDAIAVFGELSGKLDDAYNNKDAEAAAALFTEDAVLVTPDGNGLWSAGDREKVCRHVPAFAFYELSQPPRAPSTECIDNAVWSVGEWSGTLQSQTDPELAWGYWSTIYVREGNAWKMRMLSLFDHIDHCPRQVSRHLGLRGERLGLRGFDSRSGFNDVWVLASECLNGGVVQPSRRHLSKSLTA